MLTFLIAANFSVGNLLTPISTYKWTNYPATHCWHQIMTAEFLNHLLVTKSIIHIAAMCDIRINVLRQAYIWVAKLQVLQTIH